MDERVPADIQDLEDQLDAAEREAEALVAGLSEGQGTARPAPGAWSVAECLDHLAITNRVYLASFQVPADRARAEGRTRRGPARPGWAGALFIASVEPPPKWWSKLPAPKKIRPHASPPLAESMAAFKESLSAVREFLRTYRDLDLSGVAFPNPFLPGVRFSLATGLHVIAAHVRRHLWQGRRVRAAIER